MRNAIVNYVHSKFEMLTTDGTGAFHVSVGVPDWCDLAENRDCAVLADLALSITARVVYTERVA